MAKNRNLRLENCQYWLFLVIVTFTVVVAVIVTIVIVWFEEVKNKCVFAIVRYGVYIVSV